MHEDETNVNNQEVIASDLDAEILAIFRGDDDEQNPADDEDNRLDAGESAADDIDDDTEDDSADDTDDDTDDDTEDDTDDDSADDTEDDSADDTEDDSADDNDDDTADDTEDDSADAVSYETVIYADRSASVPTDVLNQITAKLGLDTASLNAVFSAAGQLQQYIPALDLLQDIAAVNDTDLHGVVAVLDNQLRSTLHDDAVSKLKEKYSHSDPALLDNMAQRDVDKALEGLKGKRKQIVSAPSASSANDRMVQRWRKTFSAFPDLKPDTIPQSVYDACNKGIDPLTAMYQYTADEQKKQIEKLNRDLKIARKNLKNKQRSVGPMKGTTVTRTLDDEIMDIFRGKS